MISGGIDISTAEYWKLLKLKALIGNRLNWDFSLAKSSRRI